MLIVQAPLWFVLCRGDVKGGKLPCLISSSVCGCSKLSQNGGNKDSVGVSSTQSAVGEDLLE